MDEPLPDTTADTQRKHWRHALGGSIKTYLITGLVILLPLALTVAIFSFVFNLLTEPFVGIVRALFGRYNLFEKGFLFLSAEDVQNYIGKLVILGLLFAFTVSLGYVTRWFFINYLIRFWEKVLARIPIISSIYRTSQDIINTIFRSSTNSFKQVVMVPFPSQQALSIGLVTNDKLPRQNNDLEELIAVFVPTTPNPTSGFLVMFRKSDLIYLDMKVDEAMKFILSCGAVAPVFSKGTTTNVAKK